MADTVPERKPGSPAASQDDVDQSEVRSRADFTEQFTGVNQRLDALQKDVTSLKQGLGDLTTLAISIKELLEKLGSPDEPDQPTYVHGVTVPQKRPPNDFYYGANLTGCEFTPTAIYPKKDATSGKYANVDYLYDRGFNCIRLPIKSKRLQPTLMGDLDPKMMATVDDLVKYITGKGMMVIVEDHSYAQREEFVSKARANTNDPLAWIGEPENPTGDWLIDFMVKLGVHYKDNPLVHIGIQNEPKSAQPVWGPFVQKCLTAMRNAGITTCIHIDGTGWTQAWAWARGNNTIFENLIDPLNNHVFDVHTYMDNGNNGDEGMCKAGAAINSFKDLLAWARQKPGKRKFFLGEFAAGDPAIPANKQCEVEFPILLNLVLNNKDVFVGYAAWAAGPWPDKYHFRLFPATTDPAGKETYMMRTLRASIPAA